jgi:hypothetical protein
LMYRDKRLEGFDAAAVVEVIEHLDAARLAAFERVLFEYAKPTNIVLTTPNTEYFARRPVAPSRSSLRVDTSRVQAVGRGDCVEVRLRGAFSTSRYRGRNPRSANTDGDLYPCMRLCDFPPL